MQPVPQPHVYVLSRTRLTPADSRSHFDTSVASCFRPARVSEPSAWTWGARECSPHRWLQPMLDGSDTTISIRGLRSRCSHPTSGAHRAVTQAYLSSK